MQRCDLRGDLVFVLDGWNTIVLRVSERQRRRVSIMRSGGDGCQAQTRRAVDGELETRRRSRRTLDLSPSNRV